MFSIAGSKRRTTGTGSARMLRRLGLVPAVIYTSNAESSISVAISEKDVTRLHRSGLIFNSPVELTLEGGEMHEVLVHAFSTDPVKESIIHVDFRPLNGPVKVKVKVPLKFVGLSLSPATKRGGFLNKVFRLLPIRCHRNSIPSSIEVSCSQIEMGQVIRADAINLPDSCELDIPSVSVIASMIGKSSGNQPQQQG